MLANCFDKAVFTVGDIFKTIQFINLFFIRGKLENFHISHNGCYENGTEFWFCSQNFVIFPSLFHSNFHFFL